MHRETLIGAALMLIGIGLFLPVMRPTVGGFWNLLLVPAAASLVYGTYLVGTSSGGEEGGSVV